MTQKHEFHRPDLEVADHLANSFQFEGDLKRIISDNGVILDVGANIGHWANQIHSLYDKSNVLMIEGNKDCKDILSDPQFRPWTKLEIAIVSSKRENITYFKRREGCFHSTENSIFLENTVHFKSKI